MKILLIVLVVIIAVLLIPVSASGGYDGEPSLEIRYLFLKKRILPKTEETADKAASKKASKAKKAKPKHCQITYTLLYALFHNDRLCFFIHL